MPDEVQLLRVLLVEDNTTDAELMLRELRRSGFQPDAKRVDTESEYLASLDSGFDLILSDYSMPQFSGLRALELLKERKIDIPFILVSATIGEETAVEAIRSGAADYLLKDRLTRLGEAVRQALGQNSLRKQREKAEEAMRQSEHKYRHLFESLSEAAFLIDAKSRRVLDANLRAEALLGRTRSEILGLNESVLFPPEKAADYCAKLSNVPADGELEEAEVQSKNGSTVIVRVSLSKVQLYERDLLLVLMADITERKRSEATMQKLRAQSDLILKSAGEGIYGLDLDGNINFINPKAAELLGWSVVDLLGKPAHETIHHTKADGQKYPVESCPIYASLCAGALQQVTNDILWRKDGKSFRVDYVAAPIRNELGAITGTIVTFSDATEKYLADARLKLQEEQYRLLFETNPNPMWVYKTSNLQILAVNHAAVTNYGYSREEFLKLTLENLRPAEDVPVLKEAPALQAPEQKPQFSGEFRHKRKDASLLMVEVSSAPIVWDGANARIVTAIDVTDRQRAEEQLREQADIIRRAHDAVIVREFESQRITFWNSGAERLYGWTAQEAIGQRLGELLYAEGESPAKGLQTLVETGEFHGEVKQKTKDGREVIVDARVTLIRDNEGKPDTVLALNTDITERKKLETQLLRVQRLESIGTLASGVAHDLNNVLTPILMCAETLRLNPNADDNQTTVSLIEESARRGAGIVKQVLTFARGVEGQRVALNPRHLIDEMIDIARKTFPKSLDISGRYSEEIWPIQGDPTQLHQVLLNLCVNARDAMPNGGSIVISAENFDVDDEYAAMTPEAKPGAYVNFRVSDTGTGMSRAMIDKIFDPFFTTKEVGKGTGLGLSTALGIVKSHGGFISVYSEIGSGTTFKVFLPAQPGEQIARESRATSKLWDGHGELVLVVDDEPNILSVTKMILRKHNYDTVDARDGTEALALLAQQKDKIKVVLTDISMPYMDGVALVRAIKKMNPDTRFIASTGQGEETRVAELENLGVANFLTKPYDTGKLLKKLRVALEDKI